MRKSLISLFLIFSIIALQAGKLKGKIQKPGDNGMISVSLNGNGGTTMSSGVSNAFSFNPNVGVEVSWGNFGLGIDANTFNTVSDFDFNSYAKPLKALDFLSITGFDSKWKSTSFTFGPSYSFPLRSVKPISGIGIVVKSNIKPSARITLSLKGGLTMNEAPDFSITNNVTSKQIAAYSPPTDFKKNAFTLKPSISFSYWVSQSVALSANVQYALQTGQTAFTTGYKDLSNVDISPTMSPDQFNKNISTAPNITTTTVGPDKYLSVGVGLVISLGKKGINEAGIKKNETAYILSDTEVKTITETLVNMRKGWDGTVKGGNIAENRGIEKKGIKKNEVETLAADTEIKAIAETLVNLARKGWDGSIKGNKVDYKPTETEIELVTKTLENIRKGWDGSVKGNKKAYKTDLKVITETIVNLRKGWDGSVKGNKIGITENGLKKNEADRKGWDGSIKGSNVSIPINRDVIHVQTTSEGCIVLFADNGFVVNSKRKIITVLSESEFADYSKKANSGLQSTSGALAQGTSLLGGALPGGAIISAAVSSVSTTAEEGASAASNTKAAEKKKKKKVWDSGLDDDCDGMINMPDGDYELEVTFESTPTSKSAKADQTIFTIEFSSVSNVLKTKHDTAKNSINNIR